MPPLAAYRVSVCIPTCNRPNLLRRALNSVASQTIRPYEVLVGDDGDDEADRVAEVVRQIRESSGLDVRLIRNSPSVGQGLNVAGLFGQATGDAILLLHDDDELLPHSLQVLLEPLHDESIVAAFGKSEVVDELGNVNKSITDALNRYYHRTPSNAGPIDCTRASALLQQFPASGYLVRLSASRTASYADAARFKNACDFAYNLTLATNCRGRFYFVDTITHRYHISSNSLSCSPNGNSAVMAFGLATSQIGPEDAANSRLQIWLSDRSRVAIRQALKIGEIELAWRWFFGPYYRGQIASLSGLKTLILLLLRTVIRRRKQLAALPFERESVVPEADLRRPISAYKQEASH